MTKQQQINELTEECAALRRNIEDYKRRHDFAVSELAGLVQKLGIKPHWSASNHEDWMAYKAALALERIAKMPLREAP